MLFAASDATAEHISSKTMKKPGYSNISKRKRQIFSHRTQRHEILQSNREVKMTIMKKLRELQETPKGNSVNSGIK